MPQCSDSFVPARVLRVLSWGKVCTGPEMQLAAPLQTAEAEQRDSGYKHPSESPRYKTHCPLGQITARLTGRLGPGAWVKGGERARLCAYTIQ